MISFLKPAPQKECLPDAAVPASYKRHRMQVFIGIFFGYAGYYLVRKNFSLAIPELIQQGYTKGELGIALSAVSLAYGISKFIMGSVSDRSNPKYFLPLGLLLSALIMIVLGSMQWATSSLIIMFLLLFMNNAAKSGSKKARPDHGGLPVSVDFYE